MSTGDCKACNMDEGWPVCVRDERCPFSPAPRAAQGIAADARRAGAESPVGAADAPKAEKPDHDSKVRH